VRFQLPDDIGFIAIAILSSFPWQLPWWLPVWKNLAVVQRQYVMLTAT